VLELYTSISSVIGQSIVGGSRRWFPRTQPLVTLFRKQHPVKDDKWILYIGEGNQSGNNPSIYYISTSATKIDLWQRAFDELEPEKQLLIKSILIPKSNKNIDTDDVDTDPMVVDRLRVLNGVVETAKTQYKIEQRKSRIKYQIQKIIYTVLGFQNLIRTAVVFDPTEYTWIYKNSSIYIYI